VRSRRISWLVGGRESYQAVIYCRVHRVDLGTQLCGQAGIDSV